MSARSLQARVESDGEGSIMVLAPAVGWWSDLPLPGSLLGPGSVIGWLAQLNRRARLVLPEGVEAGIVSDLPRKRALAVEYGQRLFRLAPAGEISLERPGAGAVRDGDEPVERSGAVVSPTDGVFYRRASPDAPPFVEVGSRIKRGQPIGLVEVMKTFNHILYDGPGSKDEAEVVEIRCADAQEVSAGEILMVVR